MSKVKEVLVDCKELKEVFMNECGTEVPELSPKCIALMTIEKASLTNLALDESSGVVRKTGGNFKEKLCEFGGLDAIFKVSMHCYALLEGWKEKRSPHVRDDKHNKCLSRMVLLLSTLTVGRYSSSKDGFYSSKIRSDSSMNSQGEASKHTNGICSKSAMNYLDNPVSNGKKHAVSMDLMLDSDGSQDPFAFDGDEVQPSKWDLLYGKTKPRKSKSGRLAIRDAENVCQLKPRRTQDLDDGEYHHRELENVNTRQSQEASSSGSIREGDVTLVTDCLLSSVKVLMNLTNDNPLGCMQIAAYEELETMASVIASHFPVFCSSVRRGLESREKNLCVELSFQSDKDLSDQELNLLVAILGLLVNLVEKDGSNRARLTKAKVRRHDLEGLDDESNMDVIPLLCSIFMSGRGSGDTAKDEKALTWDDEAAMLQGEKEYEKIIPEEYSALLLAFLSTESKFVRDGISPAFPIQAFDISLDTMTPETHKTVNEVVDSCRVP